MVECHGDPTDHTSSMLLSSVLHVSALRKTLSFVSSQSKSSPKTTKTRGKQDLGFVSQLNSKDFRPVFFPRWTYDRKRDGHESYPAFSVLPFLQFRSFSFGASNLVESPAFWNEMRIGGNPGQCRRLGRLHRHPRRWSRRQPKALFEGNLSISSGSFYFSSSSLLIK